MPRILAIDWDRHEVRGLLISSGATGTSVVGAWSASLTTADPQGLSGKQIGTRLAAAIAGQVSGKATTLVGVGRDNVQIKLLSLPPAPPAELPELVRFQSEREFTALGNDAALDFIPISGDAQSPHQALALALSPAGMEEAREVCQALELEPDRIPARGCAAAGFVQRAGAIEPNQVALVVSPLADEADLVVQANEKILLLRTVRLPDLTQADARQRALIGEIRRTIAAARQQLPDQQVSKVIICGNEASIGGNQYLAEEIEVPTSVFDPVDYSPSGLAAKGVPPASLGRFSAVLGMALGEADRRPPIVDFANVRRQVVVRGFRRVHAIAAAAAGVAILATAFYAWQQLATPARELASLQKQIHEVESQADTFKDVTTQAASLNRWLATDVNYLDEIEQMARRVRPQPLKAKDFQVANDAVLKELTVLRPTGTDATGGRIDLQGVAKSSAAVKELEDRLRDDRHQVTTGVGKQDKTLPGYDWGFGVNIRIARPETASTSTGAAKK